MYIQHFGLAQYPFSLTPNTRYFLKLPSHQQAFDLLLKALEGESHYSKIIGEVGTGKTMLCRKVLNSLEAYKNKYITAYIPHPILSEEGIMHALAEELSVEHDPSSSYFVLLTLISKEIIDLSREGKHIVLFIDEAQAMPEEPLAAVHLLTTLDRETGASLQVVLFAQPELEVLLTQPTLAQLTEEMSFSFTLPALDKDGVEAYLMHRLAKAGYSGLNIFTSGAISQLYKGSQGIPRLVNILAHKAMMAAFGKGDMVVNEASVIAAIRDTESAKQDKSLIDRLFAS